MRGLLAVVVMLPTLANAQDAPARVIRSLAYSPDGKSIAVAVVVGDKGELTHLDAKTQAVKWRHAQPQPCRGIAWLDGDRLAAVVGPSLVLLDASTGRVGKSVGKHDKLITALAVTSDGKALATGSQEDRIIKIWNVAKGEERASLALPHLISRIGFSPDGKRVVVAGHGPVNLVDATDGKVLRTFDPGYYCPSAAFGPDGKEIFTATWDGCARVWDARTGNRKQTLSGYSGLNGAILLDKTQTLAVWSDKDIRLIPFDRRPPDAGMTKRIDALLTQLDADDFATRDKAEGELCKIGFVAEPMLRAAREAKSAEVRIRARRILRHLRTQTGLTIPVPTTVRAVAFSPDGKSLACGGDDGLVRLYDASTGKPLASK